MLSEPISFVDLETTGTSANYNRIIEIGIIKVEKNKIVKKYDTLINPQTSFDPFIQELTGISPRDLENAPTFYDVKDELLEILQGSIFVAHNVMFDYGFIRNEFKRLDISFSSRHFCTVKLARLLYPDWKKYNLDILIEKFNIEIKRRHRAFDDAAVLWHFFRQSQKQIKKDRFDKALLIALKRPTVPLNIPESLLDSLPESPGVYIFYGDDNTPLYIGKSLNIKDRVLSHFSANHFSPKEMKISQAVKSISSVKTAGELGALLLESSLIKKYQPLYNRQLRLKRKLIALKKTIDNNGYNTVEIINLNGIAVNELDSIIAVFQTDKEMKDSLFTLAKEYKLCYKLLKLEKTKRFCFSYYLGFCRGACKEMENKIKYNLRFDEAFYKLKIKSWPFNGSILINERGETGGEQIIIDK